MARVLVTGCCGYVGAPLVGCLLRAGYEVVGVDGLLYPGCRHGLLANLGERRFSFHRLDVFHQQGEVRELAKACDVLVPLAAVVGAPACDKSPQAARQTNYDAVAGLVRSASRCQAVLLPNTNSGYGETDGNTYCTEDSPLNPVSLYGKTKCEAEKAVLDHPGGKSFRLATVFGASPRMRLDLLVNDFAYRLRRGPLALYQPHHKRNFVHVRDVCEAFLLAAGGALTHKVYNVGNPALNMTKLELAEAVRDALGLGPGRITVGEGEDPDNRNYLVSSDRITKEGLVFSYPLAAGVREVDRLVSLFGEEELRGMRNA